MIQDIYIEAKYFITVDMEIGYWKVFPEEEAQEILSLFNPDVKEQWKVMTMGDLNVAQKWVTMMVKLQKECYTLAKERELKNVA